MDVNEVKSEACSIAQALLASDDKYVDRVLRMWRLGEVIYGQVWGTEFHAFGVAASDTDNLPVEKVREHYSPSALRSADQELKEYIDSCREEIETACKEVLKKHGGT